MKNKHEFAESMEDEVMNANYNIYAVNNHDPDDNGFADEN